jgi:4-hydroxy-3-polyprenylbenzoate decarboxylase
VDDDIDVTDVTEVRWALQTRVDPSRDIDIIDGTLSSPLNPMMSPDKRATRDYTDSRAIVYATRPFQWIDSFPKVSRSTREARDAVIDKYRSVLAFPPNT